MLSVALAVMLSGLTILPPSPDPRPSDDSPKLTMSPAVVCLSVDGYRVFVKRPHPVLKKDEKLMLYFEPRGHTFTQKDGVYQLHLTEDVELRHRGSSEIVQRQDTLVEFDEIANRPPVQIYLMNQIELKKLTPGEYDLTIILHDELGDSAGLAGREVFHQGGRRRRRLDRPTDGTEATG